MLSARVALGALAVLALLASPAAAAPNGQAIFEKSCAPCHGKAGAPNPVFAKQGVRDFTDAAWQKSKTDADLEKTIREGKQGTMMASFKTLSDAEVKALVAYIRKLGAAKK